MWWEPANYMWTRWKWLHQFQLATEHSLKGATNYGNRATGVGTKHAVLRPRLRPGSIGLEIKTETLDFRSRDQSETWAFRSRHQDRVLDKMNSSFETMVSRSQQWKNVPHRRTKPPTSVSAMVSDLGWEPLQTMAG